MPSIDVGEPSVLLLIYFMEVEKSVHSDKNRGKAGNYSIKVISVKDGQLP